jgi:hypothetical protein
MLSPQAEDKEAFTMKAGGRQSKTKPISPTYEV